MKSFSSFSIQVLSKSLISLAVSLLLSSFLNVGPFQDEDDISHHGNLMNLKNLPSPPQEHHLSGDSLGSLPSLSSHYLAFMVIMLTIDGLIQIISQFIKKSKEDRGCGVQDFKPLLKDLNWRREMIRAVVIYTVVYCFGQILTEGFKILFCSAIAANSSSICITREGQFPHSELRLLEEIEPINDEYEQQQQQQSEGISLSLGKVLGSLNLGASHMVVTKDMKYAFAAASVIGALKVIDLSNLAAPNVVKTFAQKDISNFSRQKFLYLSPDEKTLFVSCFETLEIFNITSPESAYYLASLRDEKFINTLQSQFAIRLSLSFALSADFKTLFVGGLGLQTFDISDLEKPILLSSQLTVAKMRSYFLLTIAATADRKTLFIANGTLDSYDISDARNMRLINSFSDPNISTNSIMLSHDNKTAFGLNTIGTEKIQITKLNVTNPASPSKTESFVFDKKSIHPAWIMALSQKERYLFITTDQGIVEFESVVFDLVENRILKDDKSLLNHIQILTMLPRENYILASNGSKTMILEFYHNYPNKETFSLTDYPVWTIEMTKKYNTIEFSQGENYLFVAGSESSDSDSKSLFEIYDSQNKRDLHSLSSLEVEPGIYRLTVSTDLRRAGLITQNKLLLLDISNVTAPSVYSEYSFEGSYSDLEGVALWAGSNIVFGLVNVVRVHGSTEELQIIDFSDPKSPQKIFKLTWSVGEEQNYKMSVYQKRGLLFMTGTTLEIYNVSDVRNPHQISSIDLSPEQTEFINFAEASHDFKRFFIETVDRSSFHKLKIYDISDLKNPRFLSELILPLDTEFSASSPLLLSGDSKTIYMLQKKDILAIDVSNRKAPRIFGLHPIKTVYEDGILKIKLSGDSRTMYLVTKNGKMHSMSLQVPQTLFINQEEFYIGQHYSDNPVVLKLDKELEYKVMQDNEYKISGVSILEVKVDPTANYATSTLTGLPSWASFDQTNKKLTIEPRKQVDLGYYTLCATIFNKVPESALSFLDSKKAKSLLTELILLGYLDKHHFLTSELDSYEEFNLPNTYDDDQKEEIYEILNAYYIITCTTIKILPSLRVEKETNHQVSIVSPNKDYVKINIELGNQTNAKFLNKYYGLLKPVITSEKSHLILEGPLKEVNAALKNLTVDLQDIETCSAEMTVVDDMNPAITVNFSDIRDFFRINQAPITNPNLKKLVQRQIDTVPVYTGQYFTITLDQDTILDENSDVLNYKLISKGGEANDTIPSWITFEGLTMRGTAPEQLFDRNIDFVLIASNEFKKVDVAFRIHLKISSNYIAKMIMKYSPYLLTMIGLYIKANKIYNIFGKKIYRHKKDFYVEIGKEITGEVIFPLAFIQEEKIESEIIWKHLLKRVLRGEAKNLLDESIGKDTILKLIRETVNVDIPQEERKNLKIYSRGVDSRKKIVNQLIINKMVDLQLHSKEEKSTKRAYEKVKDQWPELVNWNLKSGHFKTDINKLYAILIGELEDNSFQDLEENLLSKSKGLGVNLHLLSCGLEAYTFGYHCIERLAIRSDIQIKEKTKKNCFQSFFKFDIETMNMNSQLQVNYGISCRFENDSLVFSGIPCENFRDKILVVEIANRQHKILKEVWIHEKNIGSCVNVDIKTEEKHYEVL